MVDKRKFERKISVQFVLSDIIQLAYEINCKTDYAVFLKFAGHVNLFEMNIALGKEHGKYNVNISNEVSLYLTDAKAYDRLSEVRDNLQSILNGVEVKLTL